MKTYANKSNARRAAKTEHGDNFEDLVTFRQDDNEQWYYTKKRAVKVKPEIKRVSDIDNPCSAVWNIAESMQDKTRKEVINHCVASGIAYYTARTQYQRWFQARKNMQMATTPKIVNG